MDTSQKETILSSGLKLNLKDFQNNFWHSLKRFPAMISGWASGKTLFAILRAIDLSQEIPNNLGLIVRKEYTDLRDSSIKDFEKYTGLKLDTNKEVKLPNGSVIMFRHGAELDVLKNINLGWFMIEQAEEFDTAEQFDLLRGRLRLSIPFHTGFIIANANGHNWIWQRWINNPAIDYEAFTATTFDNLDCLPKDYIEDLKKMETEAPNQYKQYVLNSFDQMGADDMLLQSGVVYHSPKIEIVNTGFSQKRVMGIDVARFGEDEIVFTIIQQKNVYQWEQIHQEVFKNKDTVWTSGYAIELERRFNLDLIVVDDVGVGGGVTDNLKSNRARVIPFIANAEAIKKDAYVNLDTEGFYNLKEFLERGWLKIIDDLVLAEQLLSMRFKYKANGIKAMITKDEMRKLNLKSPDRAKALMMAVWGYDKKAEEDDDIRLPKYAINDDTGMLDNEEPDLPRYAIND
jgi:hypothetical protein